MSRVIAKSSKKRTRDKICNLEYKKQKRQDWDHKAYHDVQLPNEGGDMHIIQHLVHHDMPNLVSSAFYTFPFICHNKRSNLTRRAVITHGIEGHERIRRITRGANIRRNSSFKDNDAHEHIQCVLLGHLFA